MIQCLKFGICNALSGNSRRSRPIRLRALACRVRGNKMEDDRQSIENADGGIGKGGKGEKNEGREGE